MHELTDQQLIQVARHGLAMCRSGPPEAPAAADPVTTSAERVKRLKILVQLRKLYRNLLRAERLLATSSPVYQKPEETKPSKGNCKHFLHTDDFDAHAVPE